MPFKSCIFQPFLAFHFPDLHFPVKHFYYMHFNKYEYTMDQKLADAAADAPGRYASCTLTWWQYFSA